MQKQSFNVHTVLVGLSFMALGATIALLLTDGSLNNSQANFKETVETVAEAPVVTVDADDDAFLGDDDAPIVMIEFSDYQCPYCRKFVDETLPSIKENYIDTGLVKFVYRDLPLVGLGHSDATPAANAAECARAQNGDEAYFAYHDLIFEGSGPWSNGTVSIPKESLYAYAEELDLDIDEFTSCQENMDYADEIQEDSEVARSVGINGTPGFVINGEVITGAYPYETFEELFNQLLQ